MPIEIRGTIVTPGAGRDLVELDISDAALDDDNAQIRVTVVAKLPSLKAPLLAQQQWSAMKVADQALADLLVELSNEIREWGLDPEHPPLKRVKLRPPA